mmetsp:Transcript_32482/g.76844  ORF Transcript_32482/g.76844 Transcript_32482/m.76844 type:complete len:207 (+) Transcript_32482:813-1433(+)
MSMDSVAARRSCSARSRSSSMLRMRPSTSSLLCITSVRSCPTRSTSSRACPWSSFSTISSPLSSRSSASILAAAFLISACSFRSASRPLSAFEPSSFSFARVVPSRSTCLVRSMLIWPSFSMSTPRSFILASRSALSCSTRASSASRDEAFALASLIASEVSGGLLDPPPIASDLQGEKLPGLSWVPGGRTRPEQNLTHAQERERE